MLILAPPPVLILPTPRTVVVAFVFNVRPALRSAEKPPVIVKLPFRVVLPLPVIEPEFQVVDPDTVTVSVPARAKPERLSAVAAIGPPVLKVAVPPEMVKAPTVPTVAPGLKLAVATTEVAAALYVPLTLIVPEPLTVTVSAFTLEPADKL